jgi:hypothetical protein
MLNWVPARLRNNESPGGGGGSLGTWIGVNPPKTEILSHFDGTDEQQANVTDSKTGLTWVMAGGTALDTAQKKFGATSIGVFNDSGPQLTYDADQTYFGTNIFTVEYWARFMVGKSPTANMYFRDAAQNDILIISWEPSFLDVSGWDANGLLVCGVNPAVPGLTTDVWYHLAVVGDGTTFGLWVDGVSQGTDGMGSPIANDLKSITLSVASAGVRQFYDELRVSNVARYAPGVNFTPPSAPFTLD